MIHKMRIDGNRKATNLEKLLQNKDKLISAALLGNNIANTMASSTATIILFNILRTDEKDGVFIVVATIFVAIFLFIFGEVTPKSFAIHNAEKIAMSAAPIFKVLISLFAPIIYITNIVINSMSRIFGITYGETYQLSADEELRIAIDLKHHQGRVKKHDRDMLDSVLDLASTEVREIMQHRNDVFAIDVNTGRNDMLQNVLSSRYSRIPFYRDKIDNIIGVLHVRDFFISIQKSNINDLDIESILHKPLFVPHSTTLKEQLARFKKTKHHMVFVVDEYGGLTGIVTLEDLIEEIVGDIEDEHDKDADGTVVCEDGTISIEGDYLLRDLNRKFDLDLDDDRASTIAGLIIEEIKRIPDAGEIIQLFGYVFTIKETGMNRIFRVLMKRIDKSGDDE